MGKIKAVVHHSSGISSWAAGKRYAEEYGIDGMVLLFADTKFEDEDNYRFLAEASANIGARAVTLADGRYAECEEWEEGMREKVGNHSIMTDRTGDGKKKPLTMRRLREMIESESPIDEFDFGGCACALPL